MFFPLLTQTKMKHTVVKMLQKGRHSCQITYTHAFLRYRYSYIFLKDFFIFRDSSASVGKNTFFCVFSTS